MPAKKQPPPQRDNRNPKDDRFMKKRATTLLNKAGALASGLKGVNLFLYIEREDSEFPGRKVLGTFTSEKDADWIAHAKKIAEDDYKDAIVLDVNSANYRTIFFGGSEETVQLPRHFARPWNYGKGTESIITPQVLGTNTECADKMTVALDVVNTELKKFVTPEEMEDLDVIEQSPSREITEEEAAIDYGGNFFQSRTHWFVREETQKRVVRGILGSLY